MIESSQTDGMVTIFRSVLPQVAEFSVILMSDLHLDSVFSNRNLLKRHLDMAKEREIPVFIFGDLFDAMQGRHDPRRSARELKEIYKDDAYFDKIFEDVEAFLTPYKGVIRFLSYGNHEESVIRNSGIDLLRRLAKSLECELGGYEGIIRLAFARQDKKGGFNSFHIFYSHGNSKNAVMTKGVLESTRKLINTGNVADLQVFGDSHTAYIHWDAKYDLTPKGELRYNKVASVRLPSYQGLTPFMLRKGKQIPLNGCVLLTVYYRNGVIEDFRLTDFYEPALLYEEKL